MRSRDADDRPVEQCTLRWWPTGCRWGELAALQRHNTQPDDRVIVIDPDIGALKESARRQWLGPPKTATSARTVTLPAFLAVPLRHHLETHNYSPAFPNADGGFLWRPSWRTRIFNPAFDRNQHLPNPRTRIWLIAAGIPEIAQARRLDKRVVEVYSHIANEIETRIQTALKQAWLDARHTIAAHPTPPPVTPRTGLIRRHLPDHRTAAHPASTITSFLTGKYRTGGEVVESQRAEGARAYLDQGGAAVLAALDDIATAHDTTVAAVALAWLLAQPRVVAPIASARTPEQLEQILPAATLTLTPAEIDRLSATTLST